MNDVTAILHLFAERGASAYFGEPVSQLEHALQTAQLAVLSGAADALVVAALLHDVGHLAHGRDESIADRGIDACHEEEGHTMLSKYFGADVTEPVRLHVAAKRYLCAVDDEYRCHLSPASIQSLALQGGPMTGEEASAFGSLPYAADAILLRRWDDEAKQPGVDTPPLEAYIPYMERARGPHSTSTPAAEASSGRDSWRSA